MFSGQRVAIHWLIIFYTAIVIEASVHSEYVIIRMKQAGLRSVPQNIDTRVTHLTLSRNLIATLQRSSFVFFEKMKVLILDANPIRHVRDGTFNGNPSLKSFSCDSCRIEVLPSSFECKFIDLFEFEKSNKNSKYPSVCSGWFHVTT